MNVAPSGFDPEYGRVNSFWYHGNVLEGGLLEVLIWSWDEYTELFSIRSSAAKAIKTRLAKK